MAMNRREFLRAAGAGVGLGMTGRTGWAFHEDDLPLMQPSYGDIGGYQILGYTDLRLPGQPRAAGWDQSYEFRVIDTPNGRFAYVGNGGMGWSIVDVTNPRRMRVVWRQPHTATAHSSTTDNTQYIDIKGDNILVVKRNKALETWDVSNAAAPVRLASYQPPDIHPTANAPFHGLWVHESGGRRYAFSALRTFDMSAEILDIADITNPAAPITAGRWWYPGMRAGEEPLRTWWSPQSPLNGPEPAPQLGLPQATVMCHDLTTWGDRCYAAWRDKGLVILDIGNISNPVRVGEVNWADQQPRGGVQVPPLPGQTHSWGLVNPKVGERVQTVVSGDELGQCPFGYLHFIDVRDESRPREISGFRTPMNMHANCPKDRPGQRMGTHDVERYIRGNIVHSAWEEGGFWGVDISDIHYPKHTAYYVPPVRSDSPPNRRSGHADDVFVMNDGVIFGTSSDAGAGGLWALRLAPGFKGKVHWNADESDVIVTQVNANT